MRRHPAAGEADATRRAAHCCARLRGRYKRPGLAVAPPATCDLAPNHSLHTAHDSYPNMLIITSINEKRCALGPGFCR